MEVDNKHTTEEIFDFFRNVLNILPTRNQKKYISSIHENDHSFYYKNDRQIGETYIQSAYILWLLHMSEIRREGITIVIGCENFITCLKVMEKLDTINRYAVKNIQWSKMGDQFKFSQNRSSVITEYDCKRLRGRNLDYAYVNGMRNLDQGILRCKNVQVVEGLSFARRFVRN